MSVSCLATKESIKAFLFVLVTLSLFYWFKNHFYHKQLIKRNDRMLRTWVYVPISLMGKLSLTNQRHVNWHYDHPCPYAHCRIIFLYLESGDLKYLYEGELSWAWLGVSMGQNLMLIDLLWASDPKSHTSAQVSLSWPFIGQSSQQ